jgi:hypothetical protein
MTDRSDVWAKLAASVPSSIVQWRQQGKPKARDGKFFAPFVAYIDAQFVRERLDMVVPAEWNLTLELLPPLMADPNGELSEEPVAFKARLEILGTIREDVGTGRDYKNASTDAFKRAAVRFGIGHELYTDYEITWVQVDSDSKFAKPVEDPGMVYARKSGKPVAHMQRAADVIPGDGYDNIDEPNNDESMDDAEREALVASGAISDEPSCPKCGGRVWDNRLSKRNPKAPDAKCRNKSCDGVIWKWGEPNRRAI